MPESKRNRSSVNSLQDSSKANYLETCARGLYKLLLMNTDHKSCSGLFPNRSKAMEEKKRHIRSPYFFVIHPLSYMRALMDMAFSIVWLYSIIQEPLLAFMNVRDSFQLIKTNSLFPIQLLLIIVRFNIGYIDKENKEIVIQPRRIAYRYLTTYFFFDLFSTKLVTVLMLILFAENNFQDSNLESILYVLRVICCCVRIPDVLRFFDDLLIDLRCKREIQFVVTFIFKSSIYLHIFTFMVYYIPYLLYQGDWPKKSWLQQANITDKGTDTYLRYSSCFLMVIQNFFGLSSMYNVSLFNEGVCITLIILFGKLYVFFLIIDIFRIFFANASYSMFDRNIFILQQYMVANSLPKELREKMLKYYNCKFRRRYFNESEIMHTLSENLRRELFIVIGRKLIRKIEFSKNLPDSVFASLTVALSSKSFSSDDVIVEIGCNTEEIFFISTGTVAIVNGSGVELCHLEDGDYFGLNNFVGQEQVYNVVAVEPTEVFVINKNRCLEILQPYPEIRCRILQVAEERVKNLRILEENARTGKTDLMFELSDQFVLTRSTEDPH